MASKSDSPSEPEIRQRSLNLAVGTKSCWNHLISEDFYEDIPLEFFLAMMNPTNSFFPMRL